MDEYFYIIHKYVNNSQISTINIQLKQPYFVGLRSERTICGLGGAQSDVPRSCG